MKIKELAPDERPMEKMLANGPRTLSNSELLALLLRNGTAGLNAMDVARLLMNHAEGSLTRLSGMSMESIVRLPGIGKMKAAVLLAAFELGRRFQSENCWSGKKAIMKAEDVFRVMSPIMKGMGHEELWVLFLNRGNYLLGKEMLSQGGTAATIVDQSMVILRAMEKKASSIILIHNHPSGNPRPGIEDLRQTERMKDALRNMELSLTDHVIICDDCYFSFAEEKSYPAPDGSG